MYQGKFLANKPVVSTYRMSDLLQQKVKKFILEKHLISKGEGIVVGVSGGPDSLCLAHILLELRQSLGFEICLAHLNHALRGEESEEDMDFVSRLSREWDVTAIFETADVYEYIFKKHINMEDAARNLRYNFFIRAASQFEASKVAVGHTADDQVETILMHMLRGSGGKGIRGMSSSFEWKGDTGKILVIRPILNLWRSETEEYCRSKGLEPRIDSSNVNRAFLRNRIRLEMVPYLQNINTKAKESILRLAQISAEEGDYLDLEVDKLARDVFQKTGNTLFLKTDKIIALHPALQRLLLRKTLETVEGSLRDYEAHHIERLRVALGSRSGVKVSLPGGLLFLRQYDGGWLCRSEEEVCPFPPLSGELEIPLEGEASYCQWSIKTKRVKSYDTGRLKSLTSDSGIQTPYPRLRALDSGLSTLDFQARVFRAVLSLDRLEGKLTIRGRRDGDRFHPLGMEGTKKLQDFMTDEKIPRWWRAHIPLLCAGKDVAWVVGWRLSELARVSEGDGKVIEVEIKKND